MSELNKSIVKSFFDTYLTLNYSVEGYINLTFILSEIQEVDPLLSNYLERRKAIDLIINFKITSILEDSTIPSFEMLWSN